MKVFACGNCNSLLYFDNVMCNGCGAVLGFLPDKLRLTALVPGSADTWQPVGTGKDYRMCANYTEHAVCNWMVEAQDPQRYCLACRLNQMIPDLGVPGNVALWQTFETEKRRLLYSLLRLGLPVRGRAQDPDGIAFAFLADVAPSFNERGRVLTGHEAGLITLNLREADDAERERMRLQMDEPYRTILGHFRHESGHYYWSRLVLHQLKLDRFRALFGDERRDYGQALSLHYWQGPPADWSQHHISAYASSHPWEDWAETWAHYLQIVDTLETAYAFQIRIDPRQDMHDPHSAVHDFDAYTQRDFAALIEHWLPLTYALNSLNRSMGHKPAYPFVLAPMVLDKLAFVHELVCRVRANSEPRTITR